MRSDLNADTLRALMAVDRADAVLDNPALGRFYRWRSRRKLAGLRKQMNSHMGTNLKRGDAENLLRQMRPKMTVTKTISGIYEVVVEGEKPIIVTIPWAVGFIVNLATQAGMEVEQKYAPPGEAA